MRMENPAYRIKTERMVIRCWNPADAPLLKAALTASQEHLLPWMPWAENEQDQTLDDKYGLLRRFRGNFDLGMEFVYGIFDLQEERVLGGTGLHPRVLPGGLEIGYWVHKDFINRGLATEAAAALTRIAFDHHGVRWTELRIDHENARSAAVPPKLGYRLDGTLRGQLNRAGGLTGDALIWTLTAGDYPASPCARASVEAWDALGRRLL